VAGEVALVMPMQKTSLDTALQWRALGIATIPILAGSKRPALDWERWQHELPSEAKLRAWFSVGYNLAVITGWRNLVVVDFDSLERLEIWLASPQGQQTDTYKVRTRKGWHYYFYVDEPTNCGAALWNFCLECQKWTLHRMVPIKMLECLKCQTQSEPGREQRVDIKGIGGQAITPPSIHPSGHKYTGVGDPAQIARVSSIKEVLPEYEPPALIAHVSRPADPYDMAMRQDCGISVADIKATVRWEDVLNVNGTARRGVTMVNCPFHQDDHASMALYSDKHAHCFGCNWHGDILDAFAGLHNLTIQEAMREMRK